MKIQKLELSPFEEAQAQLREVEDEITKRLKGTLEIMQEPRERIVACAFERQNFWMKIYVDEREYTISVQGRGGDINKYLEPMMEILKEELKH